MEKNHLARNGPCRAIRTSVSTRAEAGLRMVVVSPGGGGSRAIAVGAETPEHAMLLELVEIVIGDPVLGFLELEGRRRRSLGRFRPFLLGGRRRRLVLGLIVFIERAPLYTHEPDEN